MAQANSRVHDIPLHLWNLGQAVHDSIERTHSLDRWRQEVRDWAAGQQEEKQKLEDSREKWLVAKKKAKREGYAYKVPKPQTYEGVRLVPLPQSLSRAELYAILAAVHDACADAGLGRRRIGPWLDERVQLPGAAYYALMAQVVPPPHGTGVMDSDGSRRCLSRSEARRLLVLLENIQVESETGKSRHKAGTKKAAREGKWNHVWQIIQDENAVKGCGKDQKIANMHNRACAKRIKDGTCKKIDAAKVAEIRYENTHKDRHRKQNHQRRS